MNRKPTDRYPPRIVCAVAGRRKSDLTTGNFCVQYYQNNQCKWSKP